MRGSGSGADGEGLYGTGFEMNDVVLILDDAGDKNEALVEHDHTILIIKIRGDDDAGGSGFVLEGHKDEAFGGAGALAGDNTTSGRGGDAVRKIAKFDGGFDAVGAKSFASIEHGVVAGSESGAVVVGDEPLFDVHRPEG